MKWGYKLSSSTTPCSSTLSKIFHSPSLISAVPTERIVVYLYFPRCGSIELRHLAAFYRFLDTSRDGFFRDSSLQYSFYLANQIAEIKLVVRHEIHNSFDRRD